MGLTIHFTIKHNQRNIRLCAVLLKEDTTHQEWKIIARNTNFILKNNWPILRTHGLKTKRMIWQQSDSNRIFSNVATLIIQALEPLIRTDLGS